VAVQAFLVENDRNAQAAVFEEELLNGVGQFRHASRVLAVRMSGCLCELTELILPDTISQRNMTFGR
jgi:hypothetical protein